MLKKLLLWTVVWVSLIWLNVWIASASSSGGYVVNPDLNPWVPWGTVDTWTWGLLTWVQNIVNFVLWLLSFIALIILLWWWFNMITASWNEEKYKKWFTILKQSWIWLVLIWFSWLIISFIFWLVISSAAW